MTRREGGAWSEPVPISEPGYVVWRPRVIAGRALMSVYSGGETIYTNHPVPTEVEIWESSDGFEWAPVAGENRAVHIGGTETDYALLDDGALLAVARKEGPMAGGVPTFAGRTQTTGLAGASRATDASSIRRSCLPMRGAIL